MDFLLVKTTDKAEKLFKLIANQTIYDIPDLSANEDVITAAREALEKAEHYDKTTHIVSCDSFRQAVEEARAFARPGDKVILTPASASFDLFRNFEERGRTFKELVLSMAKETEKEGAAKHDRDTE